MDVFAPQTIIVPSLDAPVPLHATGDWHIGEYGCAESRLRSAIAAIAKEPRAIAILMGDLASYIAPDDARWDASSIAEGLSVRDLSDFGTVLVDRVADAAKPIRNRVVGAIEGNHEFSFSKRHHWDVHRAACAKIGCRALAYASLFTLRFVEKGKPKHVRELTVFATHGSGNAATPGGKMNRLRKYMESVDARLVLVGHMHAQISTDKVHILEENETVGEREQLGVICGTYLRTYAEGSSGYGERRGFEPVGLGHARIVIVPETGALSVGWVR